MVKKVAGIFRYIRSGTMNAVCNFDSPHCSDPLSFER
jgi:hypothetical protein